MFMNENFIQIKEASELLGVSKLTLRNWDNSGKLVSYRHPINNYRIYKKSDILKLLDSFPLSNTIKNKKVEKKEKVYKLKVIHLKD